MLHLLFHRNKNQHRGIQWWQSFASFRRQLKKLCVSLAQVLKATSTPDKDSALTAADNRLSFLMQIIIPKLYRACLMVVGDKQFVALGTVMLGIIGTVYYILGQYENAVATNHNITTSVALETPRIETEEENTSIVLDRSSYYNGTVRISDERYSVAGKEPGFDKFAASKHTDIPECVMSRSSTQVELDQRVRKKRPGLDDKNKPEKKKRKKDDIDALFSGIF
ncbi:hypothetical protein EDC01DRAFT_612017 [Geopyxis carbonaria]|nr:hypothetical protein EDC01DRAFT_612017 [Geopyxis carbonaria]